MANGINWQAISIAIAAGLIGSVGTGGIISTNAPTVRDLEIIQTEIGTHAKAETLLREINRIDGWIDEIAKKQDNVRERLTVAEARILLQEILNDLIVRLERLERREENKP